MSHAHRRILSLAPFALALAALAGPAAAEAPAWLTPKAAYMADTVMESDGQRMTGRVWASGPMERRELSVEGQRHTVILRKDLGVSWILMPEQRLYLEQPLGEAATAADRFAGAGHLEREALGQESVNGAAATRYRVHGTAADGKRVERLLGEGNAKVECPRCGSANTAEVSRFGSTPCKAAWRCNDCLEPFDYFKCI